MAVSLYNFSIGAFSSRHVIFKVVTASCRQLSRMSQSLDTVPNVDIDGHGRFKYVLIDVYDKSSDARKSIVRGYARAQWHADIYEATESKLKEASLVGKCLGGGRIEHDPDAKTIKVYGYSQGYGKAPHETSVALLKEKYPDYDITCSDEGY